MKVFSSWSGGKDSCLAAYMAMQEGHELCHLLNFLDEGGSRSLSHGIDKGIIELQAHSCGIPLVQRKTNREAYEDNFKMAMKELIAQGVKGAVFGDTVLQPHRDWIERVCSETGIKPLFPLRDMGREAIIAELLGAGFEAVVVAVLGRVLGPEWLGRNVNEEFLRDIKRLGKSNMVDLFGESGEYHTLVTAGPMFANRIRVTVARPVLRDEYWISEILGYELA